MVEPGFTEPAPRRKHGRQPQAVSDRFWRRVRRGADDECWEWAGARYPSGYGVMRLSRPVRRMIAAHRVSWALAHGALPPGGLDVCHHCDNPPCVNPAHLFLGTRSDNMRDMQRKGRGRQSQVSPADAQLIVDDPRAARLVAADFGISVTLVHSVRAGHVRGDVTDRAAEARRRKSAHGELSGSAKLTAVQAQAIADDQRPASVVAREYAVATMTVHDIRAGRSWAGVVDRSRAPASRARGERHYLAKFTIQQVEQIRRDPRSGRVLGRLYGVAQTTICKIKNSQRYMNRITPAATAQPKEAVHG